MTYSKLAGRLFSPTTLIVLVQATIAAAILISWEYVGSNSDLLVLSTPSKIALRLIEWTKGDLYIHLGVTITEMMTGIVIGAVLGGVSGLVLGRSTLASEIFRPIVVAAYSIPLITLIPLFIMFFGIDMLPKIILISTVVYFLVLFNAFSGAKDIDEDQILAIRLMGSSRMEEFFKVVAPSCMAWIATGVKTALPYSLVAATTGEMLASRRGIGNVLMSSGQQLDMPLFYSALFVLTAIGYISSAFANSFENWLLRWRTTRE